MNASNVRNFCEIIGVAIAAWLFFTEPTALRQSAGLALGIGGGVLTGWALERYLSRGK